jgi:hypothetical protein
MWCPNMVVCLLTVLQTGNLVTRCAAAGTKRIRNLEINHGSFCLPPLDNEENHGNHVPASSHTFFPLFTFVQRVISWCHLQYIRLASPSITTMWISERHRYTYTFTFAWHPDLQMGNKQQSTLSWPKSSNSNINTLLFHGFLLFLLESLCHLNVVK